MKYVQSCLSAREDGEGRFYDCRGHVRLVQGCLCEEVTCQSRFNH